MYYYNSKLNTRAKTLRREMTPWERHLWYAFLNTYPVKFYRQRMVDNFIADFYCSQAKLIVELDGGGHYTEQQMAYDAQRTAILEGHGYHVIRFSNLDVDKNFFGVCTYIDMKVKEYTMGKIVNNPPPLLRSGAPLLGGPRS